MRIVADTNVIVSAFLWGGAPLGILAAARDRRITLCTSAALFAEVEDVLNRAKFTRRFTAAGFTPADLLDRYLAITHFVTPARLPATIVRDPDDDHVIAAAIGANAHMIVSGDRDLLDLRNYQHIKILSVAEAIAMIA